MKTKQIETTPEPEKNLEATGNTNQGFNKQERMTKEESDMVRRVFGEFVVGNGASHSDGKSLHVPLADGIPLCKDISSGPSKSGFNSKDETVYPHGYVVESGYKYCRHCTRIIREEVCIIDPEARVQ